MEGMKYFFTLTLRSSSLTLSLSGVTFFLKWDANKLRRLKARHVSIRSARLRREASARSSSSGGKAVRGCIRANAGS